jgi:hypothetical protein
MNVQQAARLVEILGEDYSIFGFNTASVATKTACLKMGEGREAVTFDADGVHYAAWSAKSIA